MVVSKCLEPRWQIDAYGTDGELHQYTLEHSLDILKAHVHNVNRSYRHAVFFRKRFCKLNAARIGRVGAVEKDYEGLLCCRDFAKDLILRRLIVASCDTCDAAVGQYNDTYGGMLSDDLACAELCCFLKRNIVVEPGSAHHSGHFLLSTANSALDHVSDAIHHAEPDPAVILSDDKLNRFVGNEFWLSGHDGFSGTALRKLINDARFRIFISDVRQHHQIHKTLDEGGLAGSDGANHPNVDISAGSLFNILINTCICHKNLR